MQQHFDQLGVESVTAAMSNELTDKVAPGQGQIADQIERLVADALVLHSQFVLERPLGPEYEQVLIRHALAEAALPQPLSLFRQQKRAGRRQLVAKCDGAELQLDR